MGAAARGGSRAPAFASGRVTRGRKGPGRGARHAFATQSGRRAPRNSGRRQCDPGPRIHHEGPPMIRRLSLRLSLVFALSACGSVEPPVQESQVASAAGTPLFVRAIGNGADTIIAVHGGPGFDGGYLASALREATDGRTLLVYDMRGRGRSAIGPDTAAISVSEDVRDLEAVRTAFKLSHFAVVAHHYGALVAVEYSRQYPDVVSRMVLVGPMVPRARYRYELAFRTTDSAAIKRYVADLTEDRPARDPAGFCRANWGLFLGSERETDPTVIHALAGEMCHPDFSKDRIDAIQASVVTRLADWDYRPEIQ